MRTDHGQKWLPLSDVPKDGTYVIFMFFIASGTEIVAKVCMGKYDTWTGKFVDEDDNSVYPAYWIPRPEWPT